jgi:hypothetical protein
VSTLLLHATVVATTAGGPRIPTPG